MLSGVITSTSVIDFYVFVTVFAVSVNIGDLTCLIDLDHFYVRSDGCTITMVIIPFS